jgi:hypothetical protein
MGYFVPAGYEFGDEGPAVPMFRMECDQTSLFLGRPFLLADASFEVVVVSFSTLLAIASLDTQLFHHLGDLAPLGDASSFEEFLQNLVFLS